MHVNERWLRKKTARKEVAAKNTGWNSYSIHDYDATKKRLQVQHQAKQYVARKLGQPLPTDVDFILALRDNLLRKYRFIGATSKYVQHQGKRERARRMQRGL